MQRSTHEYLRSLNACTTILDMAAAGIQSLDDAAGDLLDIVCQSFGEPDITGIVVLMLPAERPIIAQVRAPKSHQRHVYHREPMNRGLLNVVLQTRQPALATNIRRACPDGYVAYDPVIESEIAVPLIVNEHVMGGIAVGSPTLDAFADQDVVWLEQIARSLHLLLTARSFDTRRNVPDTFSAGQNIAQTLDEGLQAAVAITGVPDAYALIRIVHDDEVLVERSMRRVGGVTFANGLESIYPGSPLGGISGRAVRTRRAILVRNFEADPDNSAYMPDAVAGLAVPIQGSPQRAVAGVLEIQATASDAFSTATVKQLVALADQLSTHVVMAQLEMRLVGEQRIIESLKALAPSQIGNLALDQAYDQMLAAVLTLLPQARRAQVLEVDDQTEPLAARAGEHTRLFVRRTRFASWQGAEADPAFEIETRNRDRDTEHASSDMLAINGTRSGVAWRAVQTRRAHYVSDRRGLPPDESADLASSDLSGLAIPLVLDDEVIAVVKADSPEVNAFPLGSRRITELVSSLAGYTISSARRGELLKEVVESTHKLVGTVDNLAILFDTILQGAMHVTGTEEGYCALVLIEGDQLKIKRERGKHLLPRSKRIAAWPIDQGITGRAVREMVPIYVRDIRRDQDFIRVTTNTLSNLAVPLLDSAGNPVGVFNLESPILNGFDQLAVLAVSQFGELVVAALEKHQLVESLEQQRRHIVDLISQAIHWLRGPIASLREEFEHLQRNESTASTEHFQATTDLLDLMLTWLGAHAVSFVDSTPEAQHRRVSREDIHELVALVLRGFRYYAERRSVALVDISALDEPILADVNREDLLGAVVELVSNALKYSSHGGQVSIRVERSMADVEIHVADEGIGVPRAERERIFERAVRGSNVQDLTGGGLGLYFVHAAMERLGGDAYVEPRYDASDREIGSRFILRFPAYQPPASTRSHPQSNPQSKVQPKPQSKPRSGQE